MTTEAPPRPTGRPQGRRTRHGIHELIVDLLETYYGDWLTVDNIAGRIADIRPGTKDETVRRALERIKASADTAVEYRHDVTTGRPVGYYRIAERAYHQALYEAAS